MEFLNSRFLDNRKTGERFGPVPRTRKKSVHLAIRFVDLFIYRQILGKPQIPQPRCELSLYLGVLRLGFLQDGDVGVGVFPDGEEVKKY
jgi:hypothetical protein